jgi:hypothetical protein
MHPVLKKAHELLGGRAQQEVEHEEWRKSHADEILAAEIDALLTKTAPIKHRDYGDVIYKTRDNALQQPVQQPTTNFMPAEQAVGWTEWAHSVFAVAIADYNDTHIRQHVEDINREFEDLVDFSKRLQAELRELRSSFAAQKAHNIVLFDPSEAMAKEIEKVASPMRAEIAMLKHQIAELKKRS